MANRIVNLPMSIYLGEELPEKISKTVLLIGTSESTWIPEAIEYLKKTPSFQGGLIFLPECYDDKSVSFEKEVDSLQERLHSADAIIFWDEVVLDGDKAAPSIDFDKWAISEKFFYGRADVNFLGAKAKENARKNCLLENKYTSLNEDNRYISRDIEIYRSLEELITEAASFIDEGYEREGNLRSIPVHLLRSAAFQRYCKILTNKGHKILEAKELLLPDLLESQTKRIIKLKTYNPKTREKETKEIVFSKFNDEETITEGLLGNKQDEQVTVKIDHTQVEFLEEDMRAISGEFEVVSQTVSAFTENIENQNASITNLKEHYQRHYNNLQSSFANTFTDFNQLRKRNATTFKDLGSVVTVLNENDKQLTSNNETLSSDLNDLQENVNERFIEVDNIIEKTESKINAQIEANDEDVHNRLTNQTRAQRKIDETLENSISVNADQIQVNEQKINATSDKLDSTKSKIDSKIHDVEQSVSINESTIEDNASSIQKLESSQDALESKVDQNNKITSSQIGSLNTANQILDKNQKHASAEIESTKNEISNVGKSLEDLSKVVSSHDSELEEVSSIVSTNEGNITKITEDLEKHSEEIAKIKDTQEKFDARIYTLEHWRKRGINFGPDHDHSGTGGFPGHGPVEPGHGGGGELDWHYLHYHRDVSKEAPNDGDSLTWDSSTGLWTPAPGGSGTGGHIIQDEGVDLPTRSKLNFVGNGVTATDDAGNDATIISVPQGGHTIQDEGTPLPQQPNLNFTGEAVTVTNDALTSATIVDIPRSGHVIQDEGVDLEQRDRLNFTGAGVSVSNTSGSTNVEILGSSVIAYDWYFNNDIIPPPGSGYFKFDSVVDTTLWTPSLIDTLIWTDASDEDTIITTSANLVDQINDKSGNNIHLTQSSNDQKPTTSTHTLSGLNVLYHDGNDYLSYNGWTSPTAGNMAVFMVARLDAIDSTNDSVFSFDGSTNDFQFNSNNASQFDGRIGVTGLGNSVNLVNYNDGPYSGPSIYNANFDFTNGWLNAFITGNRESVNSAYTTQLASTLNVQPFANRSLAFTPEGIWGEFIVIEDVSEETRHLVEGYLAHKWGLVNDLPEWHPFKSNAPQESGRTSSNLTPECCNPTVWIDPSDNSTLTTSSTPSGDLVSRISDKSGNGNDFIQTLSANQPLAGYGVGSLSGVKFDGVNDYLTTSSNPFGSTVDDAYVLMAMNPLTFKQGTTFSLTNDPTNNLRWQAQVGWTDSKIYFDCGGIFSPNRVVSNITSSPDEDTIVSLYGSVTDAHQEIRQDGAFGNDNFTGHSITTNGPLNIGGFIGEYDDLILGEMIIIDGTVSFEERQKLEGYIAWKRNMQSSLAVFHPYRNYPPTTWTQQSVVNYSGIENIYISNYEKDGLNVNSVLESMKDGSHISFQNSTTPTESILFEISGTIESTSAYVTLPVIFQSVNGSPFVDDTLCIGTLFTCGSEPQIPYVVGAGQKYEAIQPVIDVIEASGNSGTIVLLDGTYAGDLTISKPGVSITSLNSWCDCTKISGDISINPDAASESTFQGLFIEGQVSITGGQSVQLWMDNCEVQSTGKEAIVLNNSSSSSTLIPHQLRATCTDNTSPALLLNNSMRVDGNLFRIRRNGEAGSVNPALVHSGSGDCYITNFDLNSPVEKSGSGYMDLQEGRVVPAIGGIPFNFTGNSGFIVTINVYLSNPGGNVVQPTSNPLWYYSDITPNISTVFRTGWGNNLGNCGVKLKALASTTDTFLRDDGTYVDPVADVNVDITYLSGEIDNNSADIAYLSGQIGEAGQWEVATSGILSPIVTTNDVQVPALSGTANSVTVTDVQGTFVDTSMTVTEGPVGGSIINLTEFSTDPLSAELIAGDTWIVDSPSTSGKLLKFYDGTYKYSVELSRE